MFLVCVYNVSSDQPYTVFKAPCSSTALDVITQVHNTQMAALFYLFALERSPLCVSGIAFCHIAKLQQLAATTP